MNQDIMPSGWSNDYIGSNSFYTSIFNDEFGYREPPPTPFPPMTTLPFPCFGTGFGCCRKKGLEFVRTACLINPFLQDDLVHVTCLMDEQLKLIEKYFLENGIGQTDAIAIKDEARQFLGDNAFNDDGSNPDLINWFLPAGTLDDIYYSLESLYPAITPPIDGMSSIINKPEYMTLISQLKLMSDIGDPANKDAVDKDQFKTIDWNTIIPPGTTKDSFDSASILSAAETAITNAGGTVPANLADSISRTGDDAQSLFSSFTPAPSTTLSMSQPTSSTLHPGTPMPTSTASLINSSTSASTPTTTKSTTVESDSSTIVIPSSPPVTQIATQTDAVSGSGGANSNGFGNDITNSNGLGSMFGDPHIRIKNPNEPAICFDIEGQSF